MDKFLEIITTLGSDVLIPINRIKYIHKKYASTSNNTYSWRIKIISDDGEWEEFFGNSEENLNKRYLEIKNLINSST